MSYNKFRQKFFVFLSLCLFFGGYVNTLTCDKVASLPKDFDLLLPDNQKLKKIHLSDYFFLDEIKDQTKPLSIKINIKEKSLFKVQVTPRHTHVTMTVKTPS